MTADDLTTAVICGARENRDTGHYECVARPEHEKENLPHVWFKLVQRAVGA